MRLDRITFAILKRKLFAWFRAKFGRKAIVIPKIHIPLRVWGEADSRREEALYLAAPSAFWLRPDRGDHDMPCWEIEVEYRKKKGFLPSGFSAVNRSGVTDHLPIHIHHMYQGEKVDIYEKRAGPDVFTVDTWLSALSNTGVDDLICTGQPAGSNISKG
jgi:hypothetical protein